MSLFKGCGTAMATPFSGACINYEETEKLVEFLIAGGTNALVILGTTGEASTLTGEERRDFIKFVVKKADGRLPVIVGAGANNTITAAQLSMQAEDLGADGLLIVTPYYNKCTQNGLIAHYAYIAERVNIPIIVYNVPSRTGVNILPETTVRLSTVKNVSAIKEASGNLLQIQQLLSVRKDDFDVYVGDDALAAAGMLIGADGLISVAANVAPVHMSNLAKHCILGGASAAREIQLRLLPLIDALFCEVNPIPVKKALELIGINAGAPRLPLTEMEPQNIDKLKKALCGLNLI